MSVYWGFCLYSTAQQKGMVTNIFLLGKQGGVRDVTCLTPLLRPLTKQTPLVLFAC